MTGSPKGKKGGSGISLKKSTREKIMNIAKFGKDEYLKQQTQRPVVEEKGQRQAAKSFKASSTQRKATRKNMMRNSSQFSQSTILNTSRFSDKSPGPNRSPSGESNSSNLNRGSPKTMMQRPDYPMANQTFPRK